MKTLCHLLLCLVFLFPPQMFAGPCEDVCNAALTSAMQACYAAVVNTLHACDDTYKAAIEEAENTFNAQKAECDAIFRDAKFETDIQRGWCIAYARNSAAMQTCVDVYDRIEEQHAKTRDEGIQAAQAQYNQSKLSAANAHADSSQAAYEAYDICSDSAYDAYAACLENCPGE